MLEPSKVVAANTSWGTLSERLANESVTRPARLESLTQKVQELFPGDSLSQLRSDIQGTFNTVQRGRYHNEGVFMDTHLDLIFRTIEDVRRGEFHPKIPIPVRETLQAMVRANYHEFFKYALLHDLEKPDCMTVTFRDGTQRELTRNESLQLVSPAGFRNCEIAEKELAEKGVEKVSYFHSSTDRRHGKAAVDQLSDRAEEIGVSPSLLKAIELHEVAYLFNSARASNFREHFGGLSPDAQAWVLTASYIDLMGSLDASGKPDIAPFLTIVVAMENSEKISFLESHRREGGRLYTGMDAGKLDKHITQLLKNAKPIEGSCEEVLSRAIAQCKIPSYERTTLVSRVRSLVENALIDREMERRILDCIKGGDVVTFDSELLSSLRGTLDPKTNQVLSEALARCAIT